MSRKSWIEETFFKRECVKFVSSSGDLHRCVPVCQVCLSLIRCCCGRLMGEHTSEKFIPPISLNPNPGSDTDEEWCVKRHSRASPTDAYGIVDFEDTATRVCRAKYLRLAVDSKPEAILHLMLKEWQMERPKLLLSVYGGSKNFSLSPKVEQAFSKGLMTAALSTGAWILTNGINTGVSKYVGEAVKIYGGHDLRKRNTVGITPWGVIDNNADLIGRDVFRPYQPLGNPLGKGVCLNGFHSHFLFVDDGTLRKHGCQQDLRRKLEKQINFLKIHPRLNFGVPVVCVVLEGGPAVISTVLHYVSSVPPVPVFVFEGSGRTADLLAFLHKQTATHKELEADIKDDFLMKIGQVFAVDQSEASHLYSLLLQCMDHRQCITIYDSESEDHVGPDAAILTATMKGTKASPAEQLSMALAWDRADIARKDVLVYGHHWKEGSLEKTMLDALVMDRVSFVKLLIDYGMTMNRFLTVDTLEELYNTHTQGQMKRFFHHLVEDVKQTSLPLTYRLSIIDMGLVIEYLIGGAYRSSYTRKHFRTAYNHLRSKGTRQSSSASLFKQHQGQGPLFSIQTRSSQNLHFFRTAQPYKHKDSDALPGFSQEMSLSAFSDSPLLISFNFNDLFVWAVLQQRQQMALFLWQHGEEALARATVACKLYRSMATEARLSSMDDNISERFRAYSLEFGQLAVDVLDCAFRQNEQMAMKLLTSEMEGWSHFTCLQMAVSSGHRPFVSHSCTQTLLTDLWTGSLNMRKNSFLKIILSLLLPPFILILEFKSKAEMCHVPQSHEAMLFEHDSVDSLEINKGADMGSVDVESSVSFHGRCLGPLSETVSSLSNHCLSWITRIYKFYTAPVVKFWFHTMSYLAFLMLFSYTVLIKMGDQPSIQEWLVIAFVFSTALEKIREVFMSEPRKLSQKLKIWFSEYWNISDFIAIILFVFGFLLRWYSEPYLTAGRICYCLDIIFWFIRVMDLLAVNQHAGPYLTMITKMTRNMFFIVVMMAIVLLSFGVSRKSILSPNEEPSWSLARDVVFQPYWMIYGEVYAGEIDTCADGMPCAPASFLTPFLQAVYMFVQYIIMVNILIAFFNNVYFDMASTSNKLWRYNRYRYIMTYQDRPWLPPPLIFLSHLALVLKAVYKRLRGDPEKEERGSGLKLYLSSECRKKLHEFEEKCVEAYFLEKKQDLKDQTIAIKATAERAEEMVMTVWDVSDKVHSIQDSLSELDVQLGQLQDLSALAVDTLTLLSASDRLHQEEARLGQCQSLTSSCLVVPHSCTLPQTNETDLPYCNSCKSTPLSLFKDCNVAAGRRISLEYHGGARGCRRGHTNREVYCPLAYPISSRESVNHHKDQTPCDSHGPSTSAAPLSPHFCDRGFGRLWTQESNTDSKVEEDEQETQDNVDFKSSSQDELLDEHKDKPSEGLTNPAFCSGSNQASPPSSLSSQWKSSSKHFRWSQLSRDHPYQYCRSLSSSVENLTFSGKHLSQNHRSFPHFNEPLMKGKKLQATRDRGWSKSSDFMNDIESKGQSHNKKTVKIQESHPHTALQSELSEAWWRRRQRFKGEGRCWSASASLSQLNIEPMDFLQRQMDLWSPPHSTWNSWTKSVRRSSVQGANANEVRTSTFQSSENLYPHYSAMERNNLMRLAHDILFTPVSLMGGEEVSIYSLVEEPSGSEGSCTVSSWSSQGLSAILQPLSSEEGSLYGGLRQGRRVLCTWAEQDVLQPGQVYVVKAFHPEVVRTWQRHFHGSTALQLCLREIQQQRAAQKMIEVFNQIKPETINYSPQFLDVMLVLWHSNGQWLTIERNLPGIFRKFNNNTGEEITARCVLEEFLLAFSHWTYEYSRREMLVLDIQGVGEELTDPTVIMADNHSSGRDEMLFGADNLGQTAINGFRHKHSCNTYCRRLRLSDLRRLATGSTAESESANEKSSIDGLRPDL